MIEINTTKRRAEFQTFAPVPVQKNNFLFSSTVTMALSYASSPKFGDEYDFDEDDSFDFDDDLDLLEQASDEGTGLGVRVKIHRNYSLVEFQSW